MKFIIRLLALSAVCISAYATPVEYSSSTVTGDFWNRPFQDLTCCSGNSSQYQVQGFYTDTTDTYDIFSFGQTFDGYIFLYENSFNPLDQLNGLLAADDDAPCCSQSLIPNIALTASTQYYLVTGAFSTGSGTFTNRITDLGNGGATITLGENGNGVVPTPATLALFGLGLAGLGWSRRKKA